MKKVVVISTSLRPGSNSNALAGRFACQKTGACVFKDDAPAIMESVLNADVVCWATPIYYYEMSGQMKTLVDRMNAISSYVNRMSPELYEALSDSPPASGQIHSPFPAKEVLFCSRTDGANAATVTLPLASRPCRPAGKGHMENQEERYAAQDCHLASVPTCM